MRRRHMKETSNCPLCGHEMETLFHALVECDHARMFWSMANFALLCSQKPYLYAPFPFLGHRESNTFYVISFPYMTLAIWLGFLLRAYALSS